MYLWYFKIPVSFTISYSLSHINYWQTGQISEHFTSWKLVTRFQKRHWMESNVCRSEWHTKMPTNYNYSIYHITPIIHGMNYVPKHPILLPSFPPSKVVENVVDVIFFLIYFWHRRDTLWNLQICASFVSFFFSRSTE